MAVLIGGIEARTFDLEQRNAQGGIDISVAAPVEGVVAVCRQELVEPVIVAEADADDDGGALEPGQVRWTRLEGFGVGGRRNDGLDLRKVAGHRAR